MISIWIQSKHGMQILLNQNIQSSFVALYCEDTLIGKIQVKFNNGIVERGTQNNYDHCIDGIYMKNGQPLVHGILD